MPPLQSLNMKHFMIAHLLAQGKSQAEAARRLNVSAATVYNCLETPEFIESLEALKAEYAVKLSEKVILPFSEMQKKIDEESLGALSRVVSLSEMADKDSVRLKANLALLDRSSNTPKQQVMNAPNADRDLFSVSVVQLVLETALQVGDKSILRSAQKALANVPLHDSPDLPIVDAEMIEKKITPTSPFAIQSLDDLIDDSEEDDS